jgi:PrtD family type I secretion system ABC transporter
MEGRPSIALQLSQMLPQRRAGGLAFLSAGKSMTINARFKSGRVARDQLSEAVSAARGAFVAVGLFSLIINLSMLIVPVYMMQVYDRVMNSGSQDTLLMLTLLAAILLISSAVVELARSRLFVRIGGGLNAKMASPLFREALSLRLNDAFSSSSQPLRDLDAVRTFLTGPGIIALFDAPWAPIYIAFIFLLHPILGGVAFAGGVIIVGFAALGEFAVREPSKVSAAGARMANATLDALGRNAEAIHAMGMLPGLERRWRERHNDGVAWQAIASDRIALIQAAAKAFRIALQIAMLGIGAWLALQQMMSPGAIAAASIIMGRALAPIEMAIGHWRSLALARAARTRLHDLLRNAGAEGLTRVKLPAPSGRLAMRSVSKRLEGRELPVLQNISFDLAPGEALGLVGPSGSGKSTLARLLVGISTPCLGDVRLDGAMLSDWPREDVGPHIGYLPQDVELMDGSVAENIARFDDILSDKVVAAAELAGAHEMILSLPNGYETEIGEGGRTLSGGQRQRIGLARAVYRDARFIVLDEPNANLDAMGELALRRALMILKEENKTVVMITHKASLLTEMDKILVLRDGRMEFFGPREEIAALISVPGAQREEHGRLPRTASTKHPEKFNGAFAQTA